MFDPLNKTRAPMEPDANAYLTYPTWKKKLASAAHVCALGVKEKRQIFTWLRDTYDPEAGHDLFMPRYGCTFGAFCTWHVLSKQVTNPK